jgi:diacylglycerol O-acyltransferase
MGGGRTNGRRTIGPVDTIWLNMDRPNNLMVIDSVMWFDEPVDWERLVAVIRHRLVDRYPVFHQRPLPAASLVSLPHWEDDPDFDLQRHLVRATLPKPGGKVALQRYVERQAHVPLDREHPLWQFHLIDGYKSGSAVMTRFHHALADGIALAQVMLSLTDATPTADLEELEANPGSRRIGGLLGAAGMLGGAATGAAKEGLHLLSELPQLAHPSLLADALSLVQDTAHVANKLLLGSNPPSPLIGEPGLRKRTVWSQAHRLDDVKKIGRLSGATVNDVLVAAVAGAMHSYVVDHGAEPADLSTMVPVNIRPLDQPLPKELGNRFALVLMPLPSGVRAPLARLAQSKLRMDAIKHSPEATLTFGLITAIGRTNPDVERLLVNFFAAKAIGVTTNVAGPGQPRYVAGTPISGVLGWVPGSGKQTLGVCIFSYAGTVRIGFKTDATVIPDAERLVRAFDEEMAELLRIAVAA